MILFVLSLAAHATQSYAWLPRCLQPRLAAASLAHDGDFAQVLLGPEYM
jgi:hypothetical protein